MTLRIHRRRSSARRTAKQQDGYALLLVVFFASILLIGTMSIGLRTLTEGRREKEQEMIWRGKQYTRGVKMYYRKLGRFPNSMDDLVKPKIGNLRFMRQQYTDPMNKDDGSWRFIYVGPAGQLIGSLKPQNQNPLGGAPGATGTSTFGQSNGTSAFGSSTSGTGFSQSPAPGSSSSGFGFGSNQNPGTQPGVTGAGTPGAGATPTTGTGTGATSTDSQSIPSGDTPTIVGGNIIGVGSKINKASIMVYEQADNYRLFEFIWNPANDLGVGGMPGAGVPAQGLNGQPAVPGQPGSAQPGQGQPGAPGQGQSQPGFPNPNPNQNPNPNPQP
jgi:hypothetical protein